LLNPVAAVSVGLVSQEALLDLCFTEDAAAQVDMNVVMTGSGQFIELQGSGEEATFTEQQLAAMIDLAKRGLARIFQIQKAALESPMQ
jgi:ribonuclease PH